nr:unnamed protein product [Callosobruchus chinensis]
MGVGVVSDVVGAAAQKKGRRKSWHAIRFERKRRKGSLAVAEEEAEEVAASVGQEEGFMWGKSLTRKICHGYGVKAEVSIMASQLLLIWTHSVQKWTASSTGASTKVSFRSF